MNGSCNKHCDTIGCGHDGGDCLPEEERLQYKNGKDFDMSETARIGSKKKSFIGITDWSLNRTK